MDIVEALLKKEAYPEEVKHIKLFQTHISWVFLTGKYAYKVKKPVNFGFLDYSTLEKRRYFCFKEVELNKRLSPSIYLGVVPIKNNGGNITIDGKGEVIDYAVKMMEMPQERMMDKLLEEKKVSRKMVEKIACIISNFHQKAERSRDIDKFGKIEVIKNNTDENFAQTKDCIDHLITQHQYDAIFKYTDDFYRENKELFEERIKQGKICDCHGDLYSKNICITDNNIYIYDCIEFNERFRYSDTASDVAFLAMDLDFHNEKELSQHFISSYMDFSHDYNLPSILPFYKIYRAYVRGKVHAFQSNDETSRQYFDLSYSYIPERYKPRLFCIMGLTGTGKTTIAKELAKRLNSAVFHSDYVRKELLSLSPYKREFSSYNEGIYAPQITEKTYAEMIKRAKNALKQGQNVILDATYRKKEKRETLKREVAKLGIKPIFVETICKEKEIKERLRKREKKKTISDGRWEIYVKQKEEFEHLSRSEGVIIDTGRSPEENISYLLNLIPEGN